MSIHGGKRGTAPADRFGDIREGKKNRYLKRGSLAKKTKKK